MRAVPDEGEADLEGWRVILEIDDDGEQQGGEKVGQGDDDGWEVFVDEIHDKVHLETRRNEFLSLFY